MKNYNLRRILKLISNDNITVLCGRPFIGHRTVANDIVNYYLRNNKKVLYILGGAIDYSNPKLDSSNKLCFKSLNEISMQNDVISLVNDIKPNLIVFDTIYYGEREQFYNLLSMLVQCNCKVITIQNISKTTDMRENHLPTINDLNKFDLGLQRLADTILAFYSKTYYDNIAYSSYLPLKVNWNSVSNLKIYDIEYTILKNSIIERRNINDN